MKNKINVVTVLILSIMLISFVSASITGSETMTRTSSASTVSPGSTFTLTYTASGTSGSWGASIVDNSAGGCTFPSGSNTYKSVMLSEDGLTKTLTLTAPQSGTCTFTGDYQFGSTTIKNLNSLSVTVSSGGVTCTPACTSTQTCVNGQCVNNACTQEYAPVCCNIAGVKSTKSNSCMCTSVSGTISSTGECPTIGTNQTINLCWQPGSDFLSKYTKSTDCQTNTIYLIIGGVVAFIILISLLKK